MRNSQISSEDLPENMSKRHQKQQIPIIVETVNQNPNNHLISINNNRNNIQHNLNSVKSSHWLLSLITVAVAFAVIPLFPIVIAFIAGHWISKNNK
jgi:hypothetical protein